MSTLSSHKSSACSRPRHPAQSIGAGRPAVRIICQVSLLKRIGYCVAFESQIDKTKLGNLDRTPGTPWSVAVWQAP